MYLWLTLDRRVTHYFNFFKCSFIFSQFAAINQWDFCKENKAMQMILGLRLQGMIQFLFIYIVLKGLERIWQILFYLDLKTACPYPHEDRGGDE